jgi:hypothetical protein
MYKYLPPERIDILEDNLICFNNPVNFNDPFEFSTSINLNSFDKILFEKLESINLLEEFTKQNPSLLDMLDNISKEVITKQSESLLTQLYEHQKPNVLDAVNNQFKIFNSNFISATRVLSLSEDPKSILMWGHYAQSHAGFVIEFDQDHDFFKQKRTAKDEYGFLRQVTYQDELPDTDPLSQIHINHFLVKSSCWNYEKEWRMLLPEFYSEKKIQVNDKIFDLFYLPAAAIKTIILGCKATGDLEYNLASILANRKDYRHVRFLKASRSMTKFEVLF